MLLATAMTVSANDDFETPKSIELTADEKLLVEKNNDFAVNLMRQVYTEANMLLSPLSITYALGMLNNGAAGQTQQEINTTLGFGDAGADAINRFCRKLLTESGTLDEETRVDIANTIYVNSHWGYELKEPFVQKANEFYDAQPESRDFYDGQTIGVINQWASDHTEGMIKKVLDKNTFSPNAVSYLLNAIYFKGLWTYKFDKADTRDEEFLTYEKQAYPVVPMMHIPFSTLLENGAGFCYTENDLYQAIKLPYGKGAYQMTVILPREGKSIWDVLATLNGDNWQFPGPEIPVDLKLPRFDTDTDIDLKPVMKALGMPTAFDLQRAEFPGFCNTETYIDMMKQVAKIKLDEEGTEAAAVTVIGMETTGMHEQKIVDFHATRPFLYIISEQSTGAIFFIGQYTGVERGEVRLGVNSIHGATSTNDAIYNLNGQRLLAPPAHGLYITRGKKILAD